MLYLIVTLMLTYFFLMKGIYSVSTRNNYWGFLRLMVFIYKVPLLFIIRMLWNFDNEFSTENSMHTGHMSVYKSTQKKSETLGLWSVFHKNIFSHLYAALNTTNWYTFFKTKNMISVEDAKNSIMFSQNKKENVSNQFIL